MTKEVYWVSFGAKRMAYKRWDYALSTAIIMANEYGYARVDWRYKAGSGAYLVRGGIGLWVDVSWEWWA